MTAAGQRGQVFVSSGGAQTVDHHVGTSAVALHGVGEAVFSRDDDVGAALGAGDAGLFVGGDGAHHHRAQAVRPRAHQSAGTVRTLQ